MPLIRVSTFIKTQLEAIRDGEEHTSLDSVIRTLLETQGRKDTSVIAE